MKTNHQSRNQKKISAETIKSGAKALSKEVVINYLANVVDAIFKWMIKNGKAIFLSVVLFLWGAIVKFAQSTYQVTGSQIIICIIAVAIFVILVLSAPQIRKWQIRHRDDFIEFENLYWKMDVENIVVGPYCMKCGKSVKQKPGEFDDDMTKTIGEMFGEKTTWLMFRTSDEVEYEAWIFRSQN